MPNAVISIDTTSCTKVASLPVSQAWPDSYIAVEEFAGQASSTPLSLVDNISNLIIVVIILSLFTVTFMRIAEGLIVSAKSIFNVKRVIEIEQQNHLQNSRNITITFLAIILAFMFSNYNANHAIVENSFSTGINFLLAFGTLSLYLLFRAIAANIMDWVNRVSLFKMLNRFYNTYCIIMISLIIISFLALVAFESITFRHVAISILTTVFLTNLLYYIRCSQIIISNGFSHFFLILYLCTLEILPQLVLAHLILS